MIVGASLNLGIHVKPALHWIAAALMLAALARGQESAPSCCESRHAELAPLPEGATAKERWLRRIHDEADRDPENVFLSSHYLDSYRTRLAGLKGDAPLMEQFGLRYALGLGAVRLGEIDEAVALCEECVRLVDANPKDAATWLPEALFRLAAAHFREGERKNCLARHNSDSCIFPLSARAVHVEKHGAEAARDALERLLAIPDSDMELDAIWLLNIAHMALGTWPDKVPAAHRIPASKLAPEAFLPRFIDRAAEWGLKRRNHAGSVVIDDFTGDGRLDVVVCSFDTDLPLTLFRNEGNRRFTDVTVQAGLDRQLGGINVMQADIDGDGLLDLLVLRGGGFRAHAEFPNSLLRQDRPGHFVDVTKDAGIEFAGPTRAAAFADVDRDGDMDLFIAYENERDSSGGERYPCKLFLNDGKGRFTDATARSKITNPYVCVGATFADVDRDGDPDLLLSNFLAGSRLFINLGDGTFADETATRGLGAPMAAGPAGFADFDDDGDLDLFASYNHHYRPLRLVAASYLEGRVEDDTQHLFLNDGKGMFQDVTAERGLRRVVMATGLNFADVDNDHRTDIYVATGAHDMAALFPNVLYLNGDRFKDATFSAGVGHLQKGNGVAFGDLDDDGDLDLFVQVGGWFQDDGFSNVLFENPGNANHWLGVELEGVRDNRFGVGARIRARVAGPRGEYDVYRTIGQGAMNGCNPLRAHLGLGDATRIVFLEVSWPKEGEVERLEGVPLDAAIRVRQGAKTFERRERPATRPN